MSSNKNLPDVRKEEPNLPDKVRTNPLALRREQRKNKRLLKKTETEKRKAKIIIEPSTTEEKILKKTNSKFWKILGTGCIVFMIIIIVACLIDIFQFAKGFFPNNQTVGNIVGGSITGVLILLLLIFIIRPIIVALSTPVFTLDIVDDADRKKISRKNFRKLKKVAKNIIETNDNVSQDSKNKLSTFINNKKELNNTLKEIYEKEISKDIQKTINAAATKTLFATAISQNNKFDAASVILINVRMIMQICVKCGYHPTYARLSKLIVKVFRNALIAYAVQSLNLEDIIIKGIDKLVKGALTAISPVAEVTKSLTQGASNALLTLRVGIITRKYLYEEYNIQAMITDPDEIEAEIVTDAVKEANENIDLIVSECKQGVKNQAKEKVKEKVRI